MLRRAGVLALQGDFAAHRAMLERLGIEAVAVRRPAELAGIEMLVLPGGESTTMSQLLDFSDLRQPLHDLVAGGLPTLATCAGAILLARELRGDSGSVRVEPLGLLDCVAVRNAFGRQRESFEARLDIDWAVLGQAGTQNPFNAVFIRAPELVEPAGDCRIAARHANGICMVRQQNIVAATFHPELSGDPTIHKAVALFT